MKSLKKHWGNKITTNLLCMIEAKNMILVLIASESDKGSEEPCICSIFRAFAPTYNIWK